jgi:hypothetical protein
VLLVQHGNRGRRLLWAAHHHEAAALGRRSALERPKQVDRGNLPEPGEQRVYAVFLGGARHLREEHLQAG